MKAKLMSWMLAQRAYPGEMLKRRYSQEHQSKFLLIRFRNLCEFHYCDHTHLFSSSMKVSLQFMGKKGSFRRKQEGNYTYEYIMCIRVYTDVYTIYIYTCIHIHVHMHIIICVNIIHIHTHIPIYTHSHNTYIYICIMYAHIHNTYAHTFTFAKRNPGWITRNYRGWMGTKWKR